MVPLCLTSPLINPLTCMLMFENRTLLCLTNNNNKKCLIKHMLMINMSYTEWGHSSSSTIDPLTGWLIKHVTRYVGVTGPHWVLPLSTKYKQHVFSLSVLSNCVHLSHCCWIKMASSWKDRWCITFSDIILLYRIIASLFQANTPAHITGRPALVYQNLVMTD